MNLLISKRPVRKGLFMALLLLLPIVAGSMLTGCSDMDDYFETPEWIGGSIYANLESEGTYTTFLKGIDICNYKPMLDGKSILTVMAPDDDAMATYLQAHYGTTDITQLPVAEVEKLIGFHILYYSYDKAKLINFRPTEGDGASEEQLNANAGLYYKFRTYSRNANSTAYDSILGNITVYHNERLLPVFSYRMFQTKGVDAKENYEYFYPETGWRDNDGFNIANAAVTEYARIARNGYIYKIDRVLHPLETIYSEMQRAGKYKRILSMYDKSEYYFADPDLAREMSGIDSLYHHYHRSPLVNIDSEWGSVTNYTQLSQLSSQAFSMFAPTDQAFEEFFRDYWGYGGYDSIDDVDSVAMLEIMRGGVYSQSIAFPGEIKAGYIENVSKETVVFDPDEVPQEDRIVCSNGVLYGCKTLTPPLKFRAVCGPAYQYKKFTNFAQMLNNSGMSATLTQDAVRYIMLYPDNEQLYTNAGIERVGDKLISATSPTGISSSVQSAYVNAHVAVPVNNDSRLPLTGTSVIPTLTSDFKMYWYVRDGKITNSILHNKALRYAANTSTAADVWADIEPLTYRGDADGWSNGNAYAYSRLLMPGNYTDEQYPTFVALMYMQRADSSSDFFGWISLLNKAGLVNASARTLTFMTDDCLMLVPTTLTLEQALLDGRVPGAEANGVVAGDEAFFSGVEITDKDALTEYLKLYFVPLSTATFSNYPYPGWGEDTQAAGGLVTLQQERTTIAGQLSIVSTNMNIYDSGNAMHAAIISRDTGIEGRRIPFSDIYGLLPFIFKDGAVHFVEDVF